MEGCRICGIEIMRDIAGDDPNLCKWCETICERGIEYWQEYGMVIEIH